MKIFTVRLEEDLHAALLAAGGATFARELFARELAPTAGPPDTAQNGAGEQDADPREESTPPAVSPAPLEPDVQTAVDALRATSSVLTHEPQQTEVLTALCPRWMHHRDGVFCKTCLTTP